MIVLLAVAMWIAVLSMVTGACAVARLGDRTVIDAGGAALEHSQNRHARTVVCTDHTLSSTIESASSKRAA